MKSQTNIFYLFISQDRIRSRIINTLSQKFISKGTRPAPPSRILAIFFNFLPNKRIHLINYRHEIFSRKQIATLHNEISNKLLNIYYGLNQHPSVVDVITDIFSELEKREIQIMAYQKRIPKKLF